MAPLLLETEKGAQKNGNQGDDCDRARGQISFVEEEERRTTPRASRVALALSSNLRKRRALKREKHLTKIKGSAETEKAPQKTQSKNFNWSSIVKQENPETVLTDVIQDLYSVLRTKETYGPIQDMSPHRALEKT